MLICPGFQFKAPYPSSGAEGPTCAVQTLANLYARFISPLALPYFKSATIQGGALQDETDSPVNPTATIFLIEEDDDARPNLKRNLREQGYHVLVAADLEDAIEWVRAAPIPADLVLINLVGVPPEEALRAGQELRSRAEYDGRTPLVVVPEKIPEELEGTDQNPDGNDWVCYYEDADQLRELLRRLTDKKAVRSP